MKRINTPTATEDHKFRDGNKTTGVCATQFNADWCNDIQEEICNFILMLTGHEPTGESQNEMALAALRSSIVVIEKVNASYSTLKNSVSNGATPIIVDAGSSESLSSKTYYLPDANVIDKRDPSENGGVFRFVNIDTVNKKLKVLIYSEGAENPTEVEIKLDYSAGLETRKVGTQSDTTNLFSGFFLDSKNLLLSNQYNDGGSVRTRKTSVKYDESAHNYDVEMDLGNAVLGDGFPKLLINKWMSGYSNRVASLQNDDSCIAIVKEVNDLSEYYAEEVVLRPGSIEFWSSKDGLFVKVNEVVFQRESLSDMLSVDGTTEGKADWMKAKNWKLGQTRKVKNVSGSNVVVTVSSGDGSTQEITFRNGRYREFICIGFASQNPGNDTLTYLLPGDNY